MTTYKDLLAQRAALEAQIEAARKSELSDAVKKVRSLIEEFGLTEADVFKKTTQKTGKTVEPKYQNEQTSETWTGRGKPPKWIADKDREQFLIKTA